MKVMKYYCDRCKTEYKDKKWIKIPRFQWGFLSGISEHIYNEKVDLCSDCWEEAKRFFYGFKNKV